MRDRAQKTARNARPVVVINLAKQIELIVVTVTVHAIQQSRELSVANIRYVKNPLLELSSGFFTLTLSYIPKFIYELFQDFFYVIFLDACDFEGQHLCTGIVT